MEDLDFEVVDKEIEEDEAALVAQAVLSTSVDPSQADKDRDNALPT